MSITSALNNALSGLTAQSRLAEVTARNLSNALTPGYGRQSVELSSLSVGGIGGGVRVDGIARAQDPDLTAARRLSDGDLAERGLQAEALATLERVIGADDTASSLFNRIGDLEAALRALAETPERPASQRSAAAAAVDLAEAFNTASREVAALRERTDAEIAARVSDVNTALRGIARINRQVQAAEAAGRETAPLVDERERLIDRVAQNLPVRQSVRAGGVVEVRTQEGIVLADTSAFEIGFQATPVFEPGFSLAAGDLGGLTLRGLDVTPGGGGIQRIRGGALAGLFQVRDRIAPEVGARLDSLAGDTIVRLADTTVDPTLGLGDPGLFTDRGGAFDPADVTGISGRIAVNAAVDPAQGGDPAGLRDGLYAFTPRADADPTIPRALLDALRAATEATATPTPGVSGAFSLRGRAAAVTDLLTTDRVGSEAETTALASTREALAAEEAGALGVDNDSELQRLIQIEQAYAANAQVIQTASRMLDELTRIR